MATEFKCDICTDNFDRKAVLVHTRRQHDRWDLDCSMCPGCLKLFQVMLEKAKSQKSWTGWTALEKEVTSLKKETESLKSEVQFLRHQVPNCDQVRTVELKYEFVTVASKEGGTTKVHRSILISRSSVFKTDITSDEFKRHERKYHEPGQITLVVPMHLDSFRAFIRFLYTAELKPEILEKHASELMAAGYKYKIELLTRKCEDYIVNSMTAESTIDYLKVTKQCNSKAITAAAVKQIQSNPKEFFFRKDFQDLQKEFPAVFSEVFQYIIPDPTTSEKKKEEKPKGSDPGSVPGSDPSINSGLPRETDYPSLEMCTCSVHPLAHSAAPEMEYRGVHYNTATPTPSTVHYVDPASVRKTVPRS